MRIAQAVCAAIFDAQSAGLRVAVDAPPDAGAALGGPLTGACRRGVEVLALMS
jgi:hypothetical protein